MNSSNARHPLFNREFRYLWIGNTVSGCGDQFFLVALPWLILQLTGSGAVLGGIMMVEAIPRAALMLIGGAVTDRVMGRIPNAMLMVAVLMGVASAAGVLQPVGIFSEEIDDAAQQGPDGHPADADTCGSERVCFEEER